MNSLQLMSAFSDHINARIIIIRRSRQSNLNFDIRPHRRRTWTVRSYAPGWANIHPHLIHACLGPPKPASQTASRSAQPFLHSSRQRVHAFTKLQLATILSQKKQCAFSYLMHGSLGQPVSTTQTAFRSV